MSSKSCLETYIYTAIRLLPIWAFVARYWVNFTFTFLPNLVEPSEPVYACTGRPFEMFRKFSHKVSFMTNTLSSRFP